MTVRSDGFHLLEFLDRHGNLGTTSGLNWGQGNVAHTNRNDAYIPIRRNDVYRRPDLFSPKLEGCGAIAVVRWDDGTEMMVRFEGTQLIGCDRYPKQISSYPSKAELGRYLRSRLGIGSGTRVELADLEKYGRTSVGIRKQAEGLYLADFAV
jgi:hypothetical protein